MNTTQKLETFVSHLDNLVQQVDDALPYSHVDTNRALRTLRAVLWAIRDRLEFEPAIHFLNQLPLSLKAIYLDRWVVHDPQPAGIAQELKKLVNVTVIWRCNIGLDFSNACIDTAWTFLAPYLKAYDHYVFSSPEYIPAELSGNVTIIHPSIDPLSHKNRPLSLQQISQWLNVFHRVMQIPKSARATLTAPG